MSIFAIIGIIVILYYLAYVIVLRFLDCDFKLFFCDKFGKSTASLNGKVVWITGASSGIGEHLAYALAKAGCKLVLSARREFELNKVKTNCLGINPGMQSADILVLVFDVQAVDVHEKMFEKVIATFGKLDILVNNAGRSQRANWEEIDLEVDKEVFHLNTFSAVSLARVAVKYFIRQGSGHIAVTSSLAGIIGAPFSASYTGSKHALHGYFECLRIEKITRKIAVTMVCPGPIQTDFLAESFTENVGEKYGVATETANNKISATRCGHLMAVALANKLNEVWISHATSLQLTYLTKYYPNLSTLFLPVIGTSYIQKMRDSRVTVTTQP